MPYSSFEEFVTAARGGGTTTQKGYRDFGRAIAALSASTYIPKEGVAPAFFRGHHLYVMLLLKPGLITSSNNEDRRKSITLLADLAQGVRTVVHGFEGGALLEAQGPVVHAFLPGDDDSTEDPGIASLAIHEFIDKTIKPRAGMDFEKALIAFCYGPSIFVAAVDLHGDNSIVSLSPAANAPAKVLWKQSDYLPSGCIIEVRQDGSQTPYRVRQGDLHIFNRRRQIAASCLSASSPEMISARDLTIPDVGSPDSPTVEDPHESFSISVRADMDGFTARVNAAFAKGVQAVMELANEFHAIMVHARSFSFGANAIHLPWAGDCFNLLLAVDDRGEYQANRKRKILEVIPEFAKHMHEAFPDVKWAFSCAGGDIENAQMCNTLVSRLDMGATSLLLATGLPVERSLQGLVNEDSPKADNGVLWKGDVGQLDRDLQEILKPSPGGKNHRHFSVADIVSARKRSFFIPPQPVYDVPKSEKKPALLVPLVRPHYSE
jgi:hypothetical protein